MKIEDGLLVDSNGPKYCSFRLDVRCGVHCLHFRIRDRLVLSDEVPTGKKFFGREITSLSWVNEGKEAILLCGAVEIQTKLDTIDEK